MAEWQFLNVKWVCNRFLKEDVRLRKVIKIYLIIFSTEERQIINYKINI